MNSIYKGVKNNLKELEGIRKKVNLYPISHNLVVGVLKIL